MCVGRISIESITFKKLSTLLTLPYFFLYSSNGLLEITYLTFFTPLRLFNFGVSYIESGSGVFITFIRR